MRSMLLTTLAFSAALAFLAGCATAEPEMESPADITAAELETKMRHAMDPDGRYAKAKTFIQRQIVLTERFLDDPEEQVAEVKFERPDNFRLTTLEDNVPVTGLIVNGKNGWVVDYSGKKITELTPEQLDQLKVLSGTSNPDNSLTRTLRDIRLTLCRVGEQEYYKVTGLSQNGGNPVEIYIDKNDFLIRRIKAVFQIGARSLRYDSTIQRYSLYEGVMIPAETTVVQNGLKQTTRVVYYKLDAVIPASDFRPPVL